MGAIMRYDTGRARPAVGAHVADLSMASSDLPSAPGNMRRALAFNAGFWTTHGIALESRFAQRMN
jgi:putative spermidine/putrescine transport system substrate-binding protein